MQEDKNFQKPNKPVDSGVNPPPSEKATESYQEPQQKVDNFSPPQGGTSTGGDSSGSSFQMPTNEEIKTEEQKPQEPPKTQSIRATADEEPEDVFETPKEEPKEPEKPEPAKPVQESQTPPPEEQKIDLPPERKGYGWMWIIVVILILAVLAEAIAINELGIFNLGLEKYYGAIRLEKLWGGLPANAKGALADSAKKMAGKSFNLEGSSKITLTIQTNQPQASPTESASPASSPTSVQGVETKSTKDTVSEMVKQGLDIQSEVKINAKVENKDKFEIDLATEVDSETQTVLDLLGAETMLDATVVYDNQDVYINNSVLKRILSLNKDWVKIKTTQPESTASIKSSKLNDIISGGERIGSEKINNVNCYVYEVKVNNQALDSYFSSVYPNMAWVTKNSSIQSVKFYLGKRDHFIYKIELTVNNINGLTTIKNKLILNFSSIGSTIQITVPSPQDVEEKNWVDVKNTFVTGSTAPTPSPTTTTNLTTTEGRDKQRKADLKILQDALLAYKVKNGKYPVTGGTVEKTKDATSNLKTALVPTYLTSLPLDPIEKYYYGYSSTDGTKCEITSILEVKSDPDGENLNGVWIYKLRGN